MPFNTFIHTYPETVYAEKAVTPVINKYQSALPAGILQFWKEQGWGGYQNGMFWAVNPDVYEKGIQNWIDPSEKPVVIARTAFADLFIWVGNAVHFLDTQYGELTELDDDPERFFNVFLCDPGLTGEAFKEALFKKVYPRLGLLAPDECYALVPVLVLGGNGNADTVEKVKIREYLYILASLLANDASS